jgi:hypothetical protein
VQVSSCFPARQAGGRLDDADQPDRALVSSTGVVIQLLDRTRILRGLLVVREVDIRARVRPWNELVIVQRDAVILITPQRRLWLRHARRNQTRLVVSMGLCVVLPSYAATGHEPYDAENGQRGCVSEDGHLEGILVRHGSTPAAAVPCRSAVATTDIIIQHCASAMTGSMIARF